MVETVRADDRAIIATAARFWRLISSRP